MRIVQGPKFAPPYAGTADAYLILGFSGVLKPSEVGPKAVNAANQALELDSTLSDPHASLGAIQALYRWDWAESEREFRRAADLNPDFMQFAAIFLAILSLAARAAIWTNGCSPETGIAAPAGMPMPQLPTVPLFRQPRVSASKPSSRTTWPPCAPNCGDTTRHAVPTGRRSTPGSARSHRKSPPR